MEIIENKTLIAFSHTIEMLSHFHMNTFNSQLIQSQSQKKNQHHLMYIKIILKGTKMNGTILLIS